MRSRGAVVCGLVALALLIAGQAGQYAQRGSDVVLSELPGFDGCTREAAPESGTEWAPVFVGAGSSLAGRFVCGSNTIEVWLAVWSKQSPGKEAVSEQNEVVPRKWRFAGINSSVELTHGVAPKELDLRDDEQHLVVWSWFAVGDVAATNGFGAKFLEAVNAALLDPEPTAIFALAVRSRDVGRARVLLKSYGGVLWRWYTTRLESV